MLTFLSSQFESTFYVPSKKKKNRQSLMVCVNTGFWRLEVIDPVLFSHLQSVSDSGRGPKGSFTHRSQGPLSHQWVASWWSMWGQMMSGRFAGICKAAFLEEWFTLVKRHRNQILAQYKEELSSSQDWPKDNVDSSGPWSWFQNGVAMIHSFFQQVLVESWPCARHYSGFWVCSDKHNRQTALSSWSLHSSGKSQMISST